MRALLLSAYEAQSHQRWQVALQAMLNEWEWKVLSLPPRYFSWRVRGNALFWSMAERDTLEEDYDLVVATSMVDLATLRGLVPSLAQVPSVVYFHENQFAYPQDMQRHSLIDAQLTSVYSALAATRVLFNSRYNRDSFLAGTAALMRRMPDRVPAGLVPALQEKAAVLPVPFDGSDYGAIAPWWPGESSASAIRPVRLLWVGRFEHDKGGEGLFNILQRLEITELEYQLAVIGQQFRRSPDVFREIEKTFDHRLVQFGYVADAAQYQGLLQAADIVLSTAIHEFQGLAVMEAVARGCLPAVPDRLVYPEIYPAPCRYESHRDDPGREAAAAVALILQIAEQWAAGLAQAPDMSEFKTHRLLHRYEQELLGALVVRDGQ